MLTTTEKPREDTQHQEIRATGSGPILVATDGTESADAALRAASTVARHAKVDVVALSVLEGLPPVGADYGIMIPPDSTDTRREALSQRVREQLHRVGGSAAGWKVEIGEGDPATTIARIARDLDARVIVLGGGHHDLVDRLFGGETALHALRMARTPVLSVPHGGDHMPRRIVVATDFSDSSVAAARRALQLFDTIEVVYLVHVAPRLELQPEAFASWMTMFRDGMGPAFDRVKAEMEVPRYVKVETVSLVGKASREVLDYAATTDADLIVTGSSGAGLVDRILIGSTATGILRGARCAVLAVPTRSVESRFSSSRSGERIHIERDHWADELEAFTRRNAGRLATLEVDDPEIGAQAQENDYPFLGTAWDRHDERLEIMLGDLEGTRRHLTRGIAGVTGIDVLKDEKGNDRILRVAHGAGQTFLTLKR